MVEIIYDRTWYHSPATFIAQALDPCNTFEDIVRMGDLTRANVSYVAVEYLEWVRRENPGIDLDPEESYKAAILTEEDLTRYLLEVIERVERGE